MDYDIAIIGAGVIGLACASQLAEKGKSVLVIERHSSFGWEISSRNSEVIHAGIYYPKDSLKARLCVTGNHSLYEWCESKNVPHIRIGKYIVAVTKSEEEELDNIYNRAVGNGVIGLIRIPFDEVRQNEPNITCSSALWSKDTGIIDSHKLMESFAEDARSKNCDLAYKHSLNGIIKINDGYELEILDPGGMPCHISAAVVINAAGLDSDTVAEMAGIDVEKAGYRLHYCRGHYFRVVSSKRDLVSHLIYPVPHKNIRDLGIHVTIELGGEIKLGPDVQYLTDRRQDYRVPNNLHKDFYHAASRYLMNLQYDDIYPDQAGIRPKLQVEGGDFRDFVIKEESDKGLPGFINLIGIESPGLTCCIEIAKMVDEML
jgi:L-2-hydroxyglutarate oxidase LhgO